MASSTARDRVWNRALTIAGEGGSFSASVIASDDDLNVSRRTAQNVLVVMSRMGWLDRDAGQGPNGDVFSAGRRLPNTLFTSEGSA